MVAGGGVDSALNIDIPPGSSPGDQLHLQLLRNGESVAEASVDLGEVFECEHRDADVQLNTACQDEINLHMKLR